MKGHRFGKEIDIRWSRKQAQESQSKGNGSAIGLDKKREDGKKKPWRRTLRRKSTGGKGEIAVGRGASAEGADRGNQVKKVVTHCNEGGSRDRGAGGSMPIKKVLEVGRGIKGFLSFYQSLYLKGDIPKKIPFKESIRRFRRRGISPERRG